VLATTRPGRPSGNALRTIVHTQPRHVALAAAAAGLALAQAPTSTHLAIAGALAAALSLLTAPRAAVLAAVALLAGGMAGHARVAAIDTPAAGLEAGDRVEGRAHLVSVPRPGPFGSSAEARMTSGRARDARLLVRFPRDARPAPGAGIGSEVELAGSVRPAKPAAEGEFNMAAYLRRRGLAGELDAERLEVTGRRRGGIAGAVDTMRKRAENGIASGLRPGPEALARGMVLGQDEAIDPAVTDDFRASGLAHVLAVSGQNVMLLAALAFPVLAALGLPMGARIAITLGLIGLYVPLAGAGPSLQRAGVAGAASLVALAASRPSSRWYALLLAAVVTLALNPRACADPGWQLSFAAVTGILVLAPPLRSLLSGLPRLLAEGVAVTVAATLATAPLLAHHFEVVSLAALPANVMALPLVAPIMWLGMLRAALGQASVLGPPADVAAELLNSALALPLALLTRALSALAASFADLPASQVGLGLSSPAEVAAAYAALGAVAAGVVHLAARTDTTRAPIAAAWRRFGAARRAAVVFGLVAACALLFLRTTAPPAPPGALTVSFLDVGQGDATLIQHPDGSAVLFDGGPPEGRVARLLRGAGVRRLSAVVMTHASRDHHGGLAEVIDRYPVDLIVDGGDGTRDRDFRATVQAARDRGIRRVRAIAPMTLRAGGMAIRILAPASRPPGPPQEDPNARAVVAVVSAGGFELLLSADAESPSLAPLTLPDVDAMKIAHHGSADPGLAELLDRLEPELAVIEVGAENTYGHPAPSTLAALDDAGVATFRTDEHGTVTLTMDDGRMSVRPERGN
jgi:competence protein ComEC